MNLNVVPEGLGVAPGSKGLEEGGFKLGCNGLTEDEHALEDHLVKGGWQARVSDRNCGPKGGEAQGCFATSSGARAKKRRAKRAAEGDAEGDASVYRFGAY